MILLNIRFPNLILGRVRVGETITWRPCRFRERPFCKKEKIV